MGAWGRAAVATGLVLALALQTMVAAHEERPVRFPDGSGRVPRYHRHGPSLVVCQGSTSRRIRALPPKLERRNRRLLQRCRFHNIQAAVDAVEERGTRILIQPGVYKERPSLRRLSPECRDLNDERPLSYSEHRRCPHVDNLIAILGDGPDDGIKCDWLLCDLQVEGTGMRPRDVIINGRFKRLNVIRADRADGIYFRNFTVQFAEFNALYIIQTDGFVIDHVVGRWTDEYGFLTFASDHGLYKRCEAYGNGDSGVYPGSASPHHGARFSIEIRYCNSHHNTLGYSGTAGNSVFAHHNRFHHNMTGAAMDSLFPNHPGLPQNSAVFRYNRIYSNNANYYKYWRNDGPCTRPSAERGYRQGVVCPVVPVPIGTGIITAGGNQNTYGLNWIYNNWRYGTMLFWVPATLREEEDPSKLYDTSHFNRYVSNWMGVSRRGTSQPNGLDFWWDEEGAGNCWEDNRSPGEITSDPAMLPDCDQQPVFSTGNTAKQGFLAPCATYDPPENTDPPGCTWMERPPKPEEP